MAKIDDDYISREVAIEEMQTWDWQELYLPIHFKQILEQLPDADVRKVTFCRDCRHYYEEHSNIWKEPLCYCRKWLCSHPTLPEGFCNYGEVKR